MLLVDGSLGEIGKLQRTSVACWPPVVVHAGRHQPRLDLLFASSHKKLGMERKGDHRGTLRPTGPRESCTTAHASSARR